jgi:hypothetical protein
MKQLLRIKPGHFIEIDSYRRSFLHYMRLQFTTATAIFALVTFSFFMGYACSFPRFLDDADSYKSATQAERRFSSYGRTFN